MSLLFWFTGIAFAAWLLFPRRRAKRPPRMPDRLWDDETPIPLEHPLVPDAIREHAARLWTPGCHLHRTQTSTGIEWWLLDAEGELVDGFWLTDR